MLSKFKRKAAGEGGRCQKKYKTGYNKASELKHSWARAFSSHVADHQFEYHCKVCNVDKSCGYGGVNDLTVYTGKPRL